MNNSLTEPEGAQIMLELARLAETVKRSYSENDVELYLSAFHEDGIVSMPGIPPVRGHAGLRALFLTRPAVPPGATFTVDAAEIQPLSLDWAYAYGTDT